MPNLWGRPATIVVDEEVDKVESLGNGYIRIRTKKRTRRTVFVFQKPRAVAISTYRPYILPGIVVLILSIIIGYTPLGTGNIITFILLILGLILLFIKRRALIIQVGDVLYVFTKLGRYTYTEDKIASMLVEQGLEVSEKEESYAHL